MQPSFDQAVDAQASPAQCGCPTATKAKLNLWPVTLQAAASASDTLPSFGETSVAVCCWKDLSYDCLRPGHGGLFHETTPRTRPVPT